MFPQLLGSQNDMGTVPPLSGALLGGAGGVAGGGVGGVRLSVRMDRGLRGNGTEPGG